MQKVQILGHTCSAVYKKLYFTEAEYNKQLFKEDKKSKRLNKKLIRKSIEPRLRQIKLEFSRTHILVDVFKEKDFEYKKAIYKYLINYRDIDRVEIRIIGNNNKANFKRSYKIRFYNELNEEILYVNFAANTNFYNYEDSLKGYELLLAHLNINNIEHDIIDETVFR